MPRLERGGVVRFSPGSRALAVLTTEVVEPGSPLQEGGGPVVQKKKKPRLRRGGWRVSLKGGFVLAELATEVAEPGGPLQEGGFSSGPDHAFHGSGWPSVSAPGRRFHLWSYAADRVHRP